MPLKVTLEEVKDSVWQSYKEPWGFKLTAVKNEPLWAASQSVCEAAAAPQLVRKRLRFSGSGVSTDGKFLFLFKWDCSKTKQPLSQRKKTNFPRIQPFLLPPFPQLLVHCQLTASSALSSLWFSEKITCAACCCFLAPVTLLLPWTLHLPFPCSHSWLSLLTFCPLPSLPYHVLFKQKTLPLPVKPDSFTPLNLQS